MKSKMQLAVDIKKDICTKDLAFNYNLSQLNVYLLINHNNTFNIYDIYLN